MSMRPMFARLIVAAAALLWAAGGVAAGQSGRGTISGAVADATGGVVQFASVTATNLETGLVTVTQSNDDGLYSLLNLAIGTYSIVFDKDGFATHTQRGVIVGVQS